METSEIVLRLEQYDDIFSDFDMRPYEKRSLSVDFLDEMKRAAHDKMSGGIELILHIPRKSRDKTTEAIIKERFASHFARHYRLLLKEKRRAVGLGVVMVIFGIISMIAATYLVFEDPSRNILFSFLLVFLEPAAWFLLWEGADQTLFTSRTVNPELRFYRKMTDSCDEIRFKSY